MWYADSDSDGFGDASTTQTVCEQPSGYIDDATDCDDGDDSINPDGSEVCNDVDDDCDSLIDDADSDVDRASETEWWPDSDSDTYGEEDGTSTFACDQPSGYIDNPDDCNDSNSQDYPGADEICDGNDNDCDGETDESDAVDASTWYRDVDGDDYGDANDSIGSCTEPAGYADNGDDCDDTDADLNPDTVWYADSDSDGFGDASTTQTVCEQPSGYIDDDNTDCDDGDGSINPDADEICNDVDDDCDSLIDDADSDVEQASQSQWWPDSDSDTYGDEDATATYACDQPSGYVSNDDDCNDGDGAEFPGGDEYCDDGADNNCDGLIDDDTSVDATSFYADTDEDDFGDPDSAIPSCTQVTVGGVDYIADGTDCDDTDGDVNPDAEELCNDGVDNDCDPATVTPCTTLLADADYVISGVNDSDLFGEGMDNAGDINQDGYDDLIVGAQYYDFDDGTGAITDAGASFVIYGPLSAASTDAETVAGAILGGPDESVRAGVAVAGVGDINGDGYPDVLTSAHRYTDTYTRTGAVYLWFGPLTGSLDASQANAVFTYDDSSLQYDALGKALDGGSDLTGDGAADLLIANQADDFSAPGTTAAAAGGFFVVAGPTTGSVDLASADSRVYGESDGDNLGDKGMLVIAGDVNGDGQADVVAGSDSEDTAGTEAGAAYVFHGPISASVEATAADAKLTGESASDAAGGWINGVGDYNDDGYDDFVIGANGDDTSATDGGALYLMFGPVTSGSLSTHDLKISGADSSAKVKTGDVGDFDGDGNLDILVGAASAFSSGGGAYLFYGPLTGDTDTTAADYTLQGEDTDSNAGNIVRFSGDLFGDGSQALLVGAQDADQSSTDMGALYIVTSQPGE